MQTYGAKVFIQGVRAGGGHGALCIMIAEFPRQYRSEAAAKQVPMNIDPAHATAYIINPFSGRKVNFARLYSSHPPTEDRVARLRHQHMHSTTS